MPHKKNLTLLGGLLISVTSTALANPPSGYQQVFRDEFNYAMDANGHIDFQGNWFYHPPEARRWQEGDGWNTKDAASIKQDGNDGNALALKVFTDNSKQGAERTRAAAISTWDYSVPNKGNSRWSYGYFEARIKFPATAMTSWSSFWLFNFDWDDGQRNSYLGQTEIDIMEFREHSPNGARLNRNELFSNVHFGWDSQIGAWSQNTAMTISEPAFNPKEFNTYGLLWTKNGYDVFINGTYVHSMPNRVNVYDSNSQSNIDVDILYSEPHALFLSTEVRPGFTGPSIDPAGYGTRDNPATEMIIDYVAVYQGDTNLASNGGSSGNSGNTGNNADQNSGSSSGNVGADTSSGNNADQNSGSSSGNVNADTSSGSDTASTGSGWSEHPSLGWIYDAGSNWHFSILMNEWYWIAEGGQWGWTQSNGWHWLATPGWIYRYTKGEWFSIL